jgi:hypothetical protein
MATTSMILSRVTARPGWVEDGFNLEEDLDMVADDHPAAVHGGCWC